MKFKITFIFEIIKCFHEVILSQCVLDAIRVNMGLAPSGSTRQVKSSPFRSLLKNQLGSCFISDFYRETNFIESTRVIVSETQ